MSIILELPWPPSMNRYWRNVKGRTLISEHGRKYKAQVKWMAIDQTHGMDLSELMNQRLRMTISARPPDKRRRDLDNLLKAIQDALEGIVYEDDGQIDQLHVFREQPIKGGQIDLVLEAI